jgi:hypothetical protein
MAERRVTERGGGVGIDASAFKVLAKNLRKADRLAYRNMHTGLRAAGELVATEARAIAARDSTSIPPTIKVRVAGSTVSVQAGSASVKIAPLFELGNTGGSKSASAAEKRTFRHPVFNRDVWVSQPMHPFLRPAELTVMPKVRRAVTATLTEALEASDIRVE